MFDNDAISHRCDIMKTVYGIFGVLHRTFKPLLFIVLNGSKLLLIRFSLVQPANNEMFKINIFCWSTKFRLKLLPNTDNYKQN